MLYKDLGYTGIRISLSTQTEISGGVVTNSPQSSVIFNNLALLENFSRLEESTGSQSGVNRNQGMKVSILEVDHPTFTFDLQTPLENVEIEFNLSKKLQNVAFDDTLSDIVKCKVTDMYQTGFDVLKLIVFEIKTLE